MNLIDHSSHRGENNNTSKYPESVILALREEYAAGAELPALAKKYDVDYHAAVQIVHRVNWKHLAFPLRHGANIDIPRSHESRFRPCVLTMRPDSFPLPPLQGNIRWTMARHGQLFVTNAGYMTKGVPLYRPASYYTFHCSNPWLSMPPIRCARIWRQPKYATVGFPAVA